MSNSWGTHWDRTGGRRGLNTAWRGLDKFPGLFCAKLEPQTSTNQSKVHLPNVWVRLPSKSKLEEDRKLRGLPSLMFKFLYYVTWKQLFYNRYIYGCNTCSIQDWGIRYEQTPLWIFIWSRKMPVTQLCIQQLNCLHLQESPWMQVNDNISNCRTDHVTETFVRSK